MASINFVLRKPHAKTPQPVTGLLRFDNKRVKISIGKGKEVRILPEHWNEKKQCVKDVIDALDKVRINGILLSVQKESLDLINSLKAERAVITNDLIQNHFKAFFAPLVSIAAPESLDPQKEFFDFIKLFIQDSKNGKRKNHNGGNIAHSSIQKYETIQVRLVEFANYKEYDRKISLTMLDEVFYNEFVNWLQKVKLYAKNTIGKYIRTIKSMINYALEENKIDKLPYRANKFKVTTEESDSIALTENELSKIQALDLHENPRLERVRDLFILGAFTGLRYSDLMSISQYDIKTDEDKSQYIEIIQVKTENPITIPMLPVVADIFQKYGYVLPEISNQKFNGYIKEVCELAELTEKVSKRITKGGQRITLTFEKWQLVGTHTARRSFATNAYKRGVNISSIMDITGHKSESQLISYLKITRQEKAKQFKAKWLENPKVDAILSNLKIA